MNLVEVKKEYTTQIVNILSPHIYDGIESLYEYSVNYATNKYKDKTKILRTFQLTLINVQQWSQDSINRETERILSKSKCEWLDDLVKAVIKSNIILLTNTTPNYSFNTIDTRIYQNVQLNNFLHKCYLECAEKFFNSAYLFNHFKGAEERQKNQKKILDIIHKCIKEAIRKMLPFKYMLNKYLEAEYTNPTNENIVNSISEEEFTNVHNLDKDHKTTITYDATTVKQQTLETVRQTIIEDDVKNATNINNSPKNEDVNVPEIISENNKSNNDSVKTQQTIKNEDDTITHVKYNMTLDTKQETDIDKLNEQLRIEQEVKDKEEERYQQYLQKQHSDKKENVIDNITLNLSTKEDTKQQLTLDVNTKEKSTFRDTLLNPLNDILKSNTVEKPISNNNIAVESIEHVKPSESTKQIEHNQEVLKGSLYDVSEDEDEEEESITYHQNDEDFEDVFSNNPAPVEKQQTVQSVSDVFIPPKKEIEPPEPKKQNTNTNKKQNKNADQQKKNAFFAKYFEL